jgi:hypothetical protein
MIKLHDFLYFIFDKATGGGGREQMLCFINIFLFVSFYLKFIRLFTENVFEKYQMFILAFIIASYLFFYARRYLIYGKSEKIIQQYSSYKISRLISILLVAFLYICSSFLFFHTIISIAKK